MANEAAPQQTTAPAGGTDLAPQPPQPIPPKQESKGEIVVGEGALSPFSANSASAYALAQRMAQALASSSIIPDTFRDNVPNCMIAMEYAARLGVSVLAVMQNLSVIHGKPGLSAAFMIGSVNASGRFTPLRFKQVGTKGKDDYGIYAVATERASGEELDGEPITWEMVKAEEWHSRKGSKWKTMPGQMFRYRAATFWVKTYCPEIILGFRTTDEIEDMHGSDALADGAPMPRELAPGGAKSLEDVIGLQRTAPNAIDTQGETVSTRQETAEAKAEPKVEAEAKVEYDPETGELSPEQEAELERQQSGQGSLLPDGGKGKGKR